MGVRRDARLDDREPERIGKGYPLEGHCEAELESLGTGDDEAESRLGIDSVVEVYAPTLDEAGRSIGAYEIYADSARLEEAHREIRVGRGTQFSPEVVDTFLAAARRHPGEFRRAMSLDAVAVADAS